MAVLPLAKIRYGVWVRWTTPLQTPYLVMAVVLLAPLALSTRLLRRRPIGRRHSVRETLCLPCATPGRALPWCCWPGGLRWARQLGKMVWPAYNARWGQKPVWWLGCRSQETRTGGCFRGNWRCWWEAVMRSVCASVNPRAVRP